MNEDLQLMTNTSKLESDHLFHGHQTEDLASSPLCKTTTTKTWSILSQMLINTEDG